MQEVKDLLDSKKESIVKSRFSQLFHELHKPEG